MQWFFLVSEHVDNNCTVFHAIDIATGEPLSVIEWTLDAKDCDLVPIRRNISSIEQEINYLVKLKHRNLRHYLNIQHKESAEKDKCVVQILQEHLTGK